MSGTKRLFGVSVAIAIALAMVLAWTAREQNVDGSLRVHCAAGIRPAVSEAARQYEKEFKVDIQINHASSGHLLATIQTHPVGDLYIPADVFFIDKARSKGLIAEAVPLARFGLVIAVKPGNPKGISGLDDLLQPDVRYVLCNEMAAVGKKAMDFLTRAGRWKEVKEGAKVFKPTVNEAASDVQVSGNIDAGFLWDATARQYGLDVIEIPEFAKAVSTIHAGVLTSSKNPTAALRFARYLAAPGKGQPAFKKQHYAPEPGDPWVVIPKITLFAGGVNREAIEETVAEFQRREGCEIRVTYEGCGALVGQIKAAPKKPDTFLTCDASYMLMVQDVYMDAVDVSRTDMVMIVRKGNPKNITKIEDLARAGMRVGITRPDKSALGALSMRLFEKLGVADAIRKNIRYEAGTAHELTMTVQTSDKLDAVVVYEANCNHLEESVQMVPIRHPDAWAVQNVAASRTTKYKQLTGRLIDALLSTRSRKRFQDNGFRWLAGDGAP